MENKFLNICGKQYFAVQVILHTAFSKKDEGKLKSEAKRAKKIAIQNGFDVNTRQRFTDGYKNYYTFY